MSIKAVQKSDYSTGFSRGVINPRRPISLEKLREDIGGGGGVNEVRKHFKIRLT